MNLPTFFDAVAASVLPRARSGVVDASVREAANAFRPVLVADDRAAASAATVGLLQLLTNLIARCYGSIGVEAPEPLRRSLIHLAQSINPRISVTTTDCSVSVICGDAAPPGERIWCGGDGWTVRVSTTAPVEQRAHPLTALVTAAFVAGELSRRAFAGILPPEWESTAELTLSLLTYVPGQHVDASWPERVPFGTVHLVGAGAIGMAVGAGVRTAHNPTGALHVIDNQSVEATNLQRYVLALPSDVQQRRKKTAVVASALERPGFRVHRHDQTWEHYIARQGEPWRFRRVITALDSAAARRTVQACLPHEILNGGVGLTQVDVGRYGFDGVRECLACAYRHVAPPNIFLLMVEGFGLPFTRVQELDTGNLPLTVPDVIVIERHTRQEGNLRHLVGLTPRSAYARMCGYAAPSGTPANEGALVPLAHAPLLSGLLLATELIKASVPELAPYRLPHVLRYELRTALVPGSVLLFDDWRTPVPCICTDTDYRAVFTRRWGA